MFTTSDGSALANVTGGQTQLVLLPMGAGEQRSRERGYLRHQPWGCFFYDGSSILFAANEPGRGTRLYCRSSVAKAVPPSV